MGRYLAVMLDAVTVFCGSRRGRDPRYVLAARELGSALARRGIRLVWGAGRVGLMGEVADAALAAGGHLHGVIPEFLRTEELLHPRLGAAELTVTANLYERKRHLVERARAFIVLPGGLGTLDELFEVLTLRQLRQGAGRCGLLNVAGFFDPLLDHLRKTVAEGFADAAHLDELLVEREVEPLLQALERASAGE